MSEKMVLHTVVDGKHSAEELFIDAANRYDIIVAGLGTTGAISAVTAAEAGMSVFGIERNSGMGGIGVFGCIWSYFFGSPGGKYEDINSLAREQYKKGYTMAEPQDGIGEILYFWGPGVSLGTNRYVPGALKEYALEETANRAKCELCFNSVVCGVFTRNNSVKGIRYIKNGEYKDVFADVIIDALGDAYISNLAGSPLSYGRDSDGAIMNFVKAYYRYDNGLLKGHYYSTGSKEQFSTGELSRELLRTTEFMSMRAEEKRRIVYEATVPGIREVGHIRAMKPLTLEHYAFCTDPEEPLFYLCAPLDNTNSDIGFESELQQDWLYLCGMNGKFAITCGVPFKMLFPINEDNSVIKGLMTIGRGMGIDHDVCGGFRMKKDYEKLGEAAAIVAINAVKNNCSPHEVKYNDILEPLKQNGCLDKENYRGIVHFLKREGGYNVKAALPENENEIVALLESDNPELAYWSFRINGASFITEKIIKGAKSEGKYRSNYVVAAALVGINDVKEDLLELLGKEIEGFSQNNDSNMAVKYFVLLSRMKELTVAESVVSIAKKALNEYFVEKTIKNHQLQNKFSLLATYLHKLKYLEPKLIELKESQLSECLYGYKDEKEYCLLNEMLEKLKYM